MIYTINGSGLTQAASKLFGALDRAPIVERRGGPVRELPGVTVIQIDDPRKRLCLIRERKLNPWTSLAEFPWLMAGRNDVAWLKPYLPSAEQFSDDGLVWRAGYGPRLVGWRGWDPPYNTVVEVDQLHNIVTALERAPETRQALVGLWDPAADDPAHVVSKDFPCTNLIHFMRRGGELDVCVYMRSNDSVWGFSGVNVTNFTLLQELVAYTLGWPVGRYWHVSFNLHLYERHWELAERAAKGKMIYVMPWSADFGASGADAGSRLSKFRLRCHSLLRMLEALREEPVWPMDVGEDLRQFGPWLRSWALVMLLHPWRDSGERSEEDWVEVLRKIHDAEWRAAVALYMERNRGWSRISEGL